MFPSLYGIVNSQRKSIFELLFSRETTNDISGTPYIPGEVVAKGDDLYGPGFSNGKIYFEITATGDTSSVVEVGIVSSTSPNPTYADDPQVGSFGDGILYEVTNEERYFRAYAENNVGQYVYSNSPGILFQMLQINFTYLDQVGGGFLHTPYNITITSELFGSNNVGALGIIMNVGSVAYDESVTDPYWWDTNPLQGYTVISDAAPTIGNSMTLQFSGVGGFDDLYVYIRAYYVVDGVKYWSSLLILQV